MFVFGGEDNGIVAGQTQVKWIHTKNVHLIVLNTKISKIVGCTLERFGELPNEFEDGACGTFQFSSGEDRVMFCFPKSDGKKCFR